MNRLIKFFNEKYGNKYGKISYPRTTIQIYRVYQSIKSYGINDEELVKLLHDIKLPKPKTIEEKELYADCLYNKDDSEIKIDTSNLVSKESPVFTGSISMGRKEGTAIGENSVAIGKNVEASGSYSRAEGNGTIASGFGSHAEGYITKATSSYAHAEGRNSTASEFNSHAEGNGTIASGFGSHAEGLNCVASGESSHAEGRKTIASSDYQHTQGKYNIEDNNNKYAHIVGNGTDDNNHSNAHTLDWEGNAWYAGQVEGTNLPYNISSKVLVTISANNVKLGEDIVINNISIKNRRYYIEFLGVKKLCSLVLNGEGDNIVCSINNYTIEAYKDSTNIIINISKIDENINDVAFTDLIIHEEENKHLDSKYLETDLVLQNSISLERVGDIGIKSCAIGREVEASGDNSHAEGYGTTASGYNSHAEGNTTTASGDSSHVEGYGTKALGEYQHVQGKYNIEDTENKYAHIVGNGNNNDARSNAHTLDWNGNAWYAGDVQANNVPHVASEKVVLTIPAASISAKKSEIDNANQDNPVEIPVDGAVTYDPTKSYYLKYNNREYYAVHGDGGMLTIVEDGCLCAFMSQENATVMMIATLDTTNITDAQLIENDIKKLDNKYVPNDLKVNKSITVGIRNGTIGKYSSSFGFACEASGRFSHAEGDENTASGEASHAEGNYTTASGRFSHAEGSSTTASGDSSHTEGYNTSASGKYSHAECYNTSAAGNHSHAEGFGTTALGDNSHAEGHATVAQCENQHVQGKYNIEDTANKYAHIVGNGSENNKSNAHTLDWKGNAWFAGDVKGTNLPYNISSKVLATVPASNIKLDNEIPVNNVSINKDKRYYIEFLGIEKLCSLSLDDIEGNAIICSINNYKIEVYNDSTNITISINKIDKKINDDTFTDLIIHEEENKYLDSKYLESDLILQNSISMGRVGNLGVGSSAVGYNVEASGDYSHAEGINTAASGNYSHAEGNGTTASGEVSYAEGSETTASGDGSHAEGSNTVALGNYSHAEGSLTRASGHYSHAEGSYTVALGNYSHAEGSYTKASSEYQHVQGRYNTEDAEGKYAHIVGNGSENTSSNAHTLDWNGNGWYAGKLSQEGTPTEDKDLITKKYFDDGISSLPQISFNENSELVVTINGVSKIFVPKS